MEDQSDSNINYFIAGIAAGMVVTILSELKSAAETGGYSGRKAAEVKEFVQRRAHEFRERAQNLVERAS
jgi:hypothetical protein